jgi:sensor histidine kinase regulating citrate/malate metabolism
VGGRHRHGIDLDKHCPQTIRALPPFSYYVEGNGLGLFLIKTQIESLAGKVALENQEGAGNTFNIYFKATP